jgi:hypothetical protein
VDVQSLGQRNASGDLLCTNLGLSLASTSCVNRVDLYGLNEMAQTLAHPKQTPRLTASIQASWRLIRIGKTTSERSYVLSQSVCHCNLTRTKRGWNRKRREEGRSTSSDTHAMAKDEAMERSDTRKNTSAQSTCRVPRPRCTKCPKTSLKFSVMQLSLQEPRRRYSLQGTSIQGLRHNKTKRREGHKIHLPLLHSP